MREEQKHSKGKLLLIPILSAVLAYVIYDGFSGSGGRTPTSPAPTNSSASPLSPGQSGSAIGLKQPQAAASPRSATASSDNELTRSVEWPSAALREILAFDPFRLENLAAAPEVEDQSADTGPMIASGDDTVSSQTGNPDESPDLILQPVFEPNETARFPADEASLAAEAARRQRTEQLLEDIRRLQAMPVTMVMKSGSGYRALMNDRWFRPGDEAAPGVRVADITESGVTFSVTLPHESAD